jgi:hypothetical protein
MTRQSEKVRDVLMVTAAILAVILISGGRGCIFRVESEPITSNVVANFLLAPIQKGSDGKCPEDRFEFDNVCMRSWK